MITVNGMELEYSDNLLSLLKHLNYRIDRIAVEINGSIIKKSDYSKTDLHSGDKIEIVSFVGGG